MHDIIDLKTQCNALRATIKTVGEQTLNLKLHPAMATAGSDQAPSADRGEMLANIMLTYRHLEDARMRLGKVVQAYEGGTSVFDKEAARREPMPLA